MCVLEFLAKCSSVACRPPLTDLVFAVTVSVLFQQKASISGSLAFALHHSLLFCVPPSFCVPHSSKSLDSPNLFERNLSYVNLFTHAPEYLIWELRGTPEKILTAEAVVIICMSLVLSHICKRLFE